MPHEQLERTLKDLEHAGTFVEERDGRQVWQFDHAGKTYRLHFYPRKSGRLSGGSAALREFNGLTSLQRAKVPAPHAVALLSGFRIKQQLGDAVVLEQLDSAIALDQYLAQFESRGQTVPTRRELATQLRTIVTQLGTAKLGHRRLGLNHLLLHENRLCLTGARHVHGGGLVMKDVLHLGHSARSLATRTEILRTWEALVPGDPMPNRNPVSKQIWTDWLKRSWGENDYFGRLVGGAWAGFFTRRSALPRRWAPASRLTISTQDWQSAWPVLLKQIESDQLEVIKRGDSGDVLAGEVILGGKPVAVIIKRPKRKSWKQTIVDLARPSRAKRTWIKTWKMIVRDVPCEWPMLCMEKKRFGRVSDAVIVFGKVEGPTLADVDLDAMQPGPRELLFRRVGKILKRIESLGFTHMDAKSTNWIVFDDGAPVGPLPVLIDLDGVRHYRWAKAGLLRLLRAMNTHEQFTTVDREGIEAGYFGRAEKLASTERR